ncbi:proline-, glutamic acid- and leucine-rich protein 1 [Orussus abietinus]|uniref:proline-, glutamic acid- and leucine-rich protein 1 n=1 Tax=Orussus abietinus TaxID=222816 RepID=UPI0006265E89|nr:proline-, glutamic acid- and leucine-rich protein 1 [Orussus abietinus]XP_012272951.1 proline-, glutamic acid- and leucine-rich protein 1 [Orussus abietinus]
MYATSTCFLPLAVTCIAETTSRLDKARGHDSVVSDMAQILNIINSFDQNSSEYNKFLDTFLSSRCDIPFAKDEINSVQNSIISAINTRLNQANTRRSGLEILYKVLARYPKENLLKYAILWITKATAPLENIHSDVYDLTLACKVLGLLIINCKGLAELQKQISTQNVKQIISLITNLEAEKRCGATFYLTAVLLHHYPEACEKLQTSIRTIILPLVDSTRNNLVNCGASCYTLLAKATVRTFKPPPTKSTYTAWLYNEVLLCNSLHAIMDDLFSGLVELEDIEVSDKLELPEISQDNVLEYYHDIERRFLNLCTYLSTMLCCGYGEKNSVSPHDILRVLCRGLAVTPTCLKGNDSIKNQILQFILPSLQVGLMSVLDALINGFRHELAPYALTILQLFQQTLKWTEAEIESSSTFGGSKPFNQLRISVYQTLSTWLVIIGSLSGFEMVADEFLPHISKDIIPERDRIMLTVQKPQHLSRKALKRLRDSQYENSTTLGNTTETCTDPCLNAELCKNALYALQNIFFSAGCWLKQSFYTNIQNIVVILLYDFYLGSAGKTFYSENVDCRLHLLKTLKAVQLNPHPLVPPPTQYSIEIFEMALSDVNTNIIQESQVGLKELEKIVHPAAPTLDLPIPENVIGNQNDCEMECSEPINHTGSVNIQNGV